MNKAILTRQQIVVTIGIECFTKFPIYILIVLNQIVYTALCLSVFVANITNYYSLHHRQICHRPNCRPSYYYHHYLKSS